MTTNSRDVQDFASLPELVALATARDGAAHCILAPGLPALSFQRLYAQICDVEAQLRAAGIGPGACVASALPNGPNAASALPTFASSCLYAPLSRDDDQHAFERAFEQLNPALLVLESGDVGPARAAADAAGICVIELETPQGFEAGRFRFSIPKSRSTRLNPSSNQAPGLLIQTSGTTSRPKYAHHSHRSLYHGTRILIRAHALTPVDRCLNIAALHHSLGVIGSVLISIISGASVVCTSGFDADEFPNWIRNFSPTWFAAVPSILLAAASVASDHPELLRAHPLRFVRTAGARLSPETRRKVEDALRAPVIQAFGMSECPPITVDPLSLTQRRANSVGTVSEPEVAIWDDNDTALGPNRAGHIVVRGPNLMANYYNDEAANARAFTNGWFRTGDCGYVDESGFLFLTGRASGFINRGGEKIAPGEIDDLFCSHPDVVQSVTFAVHDEILGEEVATAIVPRHEGAVTIDQLRRFAATRLAFHKFPRRIHLVSEIPYGRTGKPDRNALRTRFDRIHSEADERLIPKVLARTGLEKQIAKVWAEVLGIPDPGIHDHFFDSGGDSLAAARLLAGIAEAVGVEGLRLGLLMQAPTIAELALLLKNRESGRASVLPLKATGREAPLFWIDGYAARAVIEGIAPDRPVFMLSLPNPRSRDAGKLINQYAGECLDTLRQFRPKGPYLLAGWCAAGVIALEMARRLQTQGEAVGLILFDVRGVLRRDSTSLKSRWISAVRAAEKLVYHLDRLNRLEAAAALGYVAEAIERRADRVRRDLLGRWRTASACGPTDELLYATAIRNYRAETYSGRTVHIWAQDRPRGPFRDLDDEWGWVGKGHMKLYEAAGNHITMFQGSNGRALGRLMNHCLDELEVDLSARVPNHSKDEAICFEAALAV